MRRSLSATLYQNPSLAFFWAPSSIGFFLIRPDTVTLWLLPLFVVFAGSLSGWHLICS
jgi:hypothetical protein